MRAETNSGQKNIIIVLLLAVILVIAAMTNPKKDDYSNWVKEQLVQNTDGQLGKALTTLFAPTIVNESTVAQNYVFFSVFRTDVDKYHITTIGLFNNYIPIENNTE